MDNKQRGIKEIENSGWDQMRKSLDKEMPNNKRRFFWIFISLGLIATSFLLYQTMHDSSSPNEVHTTEPIAQLINKTKGDIENKKTIESGAENLEKLFLTNEKKQNIKLLPQAQQAQNIIGKEHKIKYSNRIITKEIYHTSTKKSQPQLNEKYNKTESYLLVNSRNDLNNTQHELKNKVVDKIQLLMYLHVNKYDEDKINIDLRSVNTKSQLKEFATNINRKWHPYVQAQIGMMSKYNSVGIGIGVGVSYNYNNIISFFVGGNYQRTKYNNLNFAKIFNKEMDHISNQWNPNISPNLINTNVIDQYILESNQLELSMGMEYKLNKTWGISSSFGMAFSQLLNANSEQQYDYSGIRDDLKLNSNASRVNKVSLAEVVELSKKGTSYNALIPIADLKLSYNFSSHFSINLGYSHYFNSIIKEVELFPSIKLKSSFEASRIFFGIKYQV